MERSFNSLYKIIEKNNVADAYVGLLKDDITDKHIACIVNNQVHALDYEIREDARVELLDTLSKEGRNVYIRGIMFIMGKAFHDVYPEALLTVNYQLHNSMYCRIENMEVTEEMISKVKKRMREIIDLKLPITKTVMSVEEAKAFYAQNKMTYGKFQIINHAKKIPLYFCGDYYNYLYGTMPLHTGMMPYFDLEKTLISKTKSYYESEHSYPAKGQSVKVTFDELKNANLIEELKVNDDTCEGYVKVENNGVIEYKAYIKCNNYTTKDYDK